MKGLYMKRALVLFLAVQLTLAAGAQNNTDGLFPLRPAAWDELYRASCTLYLTNYPYGSGVLVGVCRRDGCPQTYLLTATHVAKHVLEHSKTFFRMASVDESGKNAAVFDVSISRDKYIPFLHTDLCAIDITPDIMRYVSRGNEFTMQFIPLNTSHLVSSLTNDWWCGVSRYADFEKHDIRLGTPCKLIGSNLWMWKRFADRQSSSLCLFEGSLAALPASNSRILTFPPSTNGCPAFVTTIPAIHGMSGGPVFAMGKTSDGREYPYLIGIAVSQLYDDLTPLIECRQPIEKLQDFKAFAKATAIYQHSFNDKGSYVATLDPFLDSLTNAVKRMPGAYPLID